MTAHVRPARVDDADACIELSARAHGADRLDGYSDAQAEWVRSLFADEVLQRRILLVDDGGPVAMAAAIPQTWVVAGADVPVARLEAFGTHPAHVGLGYAGRLCEELEAQAIEAGDVLSVISGLAWFYRRFGYVYGPAHEVTYSVTVPVSQSTAALRAATTADAELIGDWYDDAHADANVWCRRTIHDTLRALTHRAPSHEARQYLIAHERGVEIGYVALRGSTVDELGGSDPFAVLASVANRLATQTLQCQLGEDHPALQGLFAVAQRPYAWYVKALDPARMIASATTFPSWSGAFVLHEHIRGWQIELTDGTVTAVDTVDPSITAAIHGLAPTPDVPGPSGVLLVPPGEWLPGAFGARDLSTTLLQFPDVSIEGDIAELVDTWWARGPARIAPAA